MYSPPSTPDLPWCLAGSEGRDGGALPASYSELARDFHGKSGDNIDINQVNEQYLEMMTTWDAYGYHYTL